MYTAASKLAQARRFHLTKTILESHGFFLKKTPRTSSQEVSVTSFTSKKQLSLQRGCMIQISLKYNFFSRYLLKIENINKIIIKILSIYSSNKQRQRKVMVTKGVKST